MLRLNLGCVMISVMNKNLRRGKYDPGYQFQK